MLDEPVSSLDPLARREFLQALMDVVAAGQLSVVLSSHLVADLERVCDHLIVSAASRVRSPGRSTPPGHPPPADRAPPGRTAPLRRTSSSSRADHTDKQSTLLVRAEDPILDPAWTVEQLSLEDLVLAYMSQAADAAPGRRPVLEVQR